MPTPIEQYFPSFAELFSRFPARTPLVRTEPDRYTPQAIIWRAANLAADHALVRDPTVQPLISTSTLYQDAQRPAGYPGIKNLDGSYYGGFPIDYNPGNNINARWSAEAIELRARLTARMFAMNRHHIGAFGNNGARGFYYDVGLQGAGNGDSFGLAGLPVRLGSNPGDANVCHGVSAPFNGVSTIPVGSGWSFEGMDTNRINIWQAAAQQDLERYGDAFFDECERIQQIFPMIMPEGMIDDVENYFNLQFTMHSVGYVPNLGVAAGLEGYSATPSPNVRGFAVPGYVKFNGIENLVNDPRYTSEIVARDRSGKTYTLAQYFDHLKTKLGWDGTFPGNYTLDTVTDGHPLRAVSAALNWFVRHIRDRAMMDSFLKGRMRYGSYNHYANKIDGDGTTNWVDYAQYSLYDTKPTGFFLPDFSVRTLYTADFVGTACASVSGPQRQALIDKKLAWLAATDMTGVEPIVSDAYPVPDGSSNFYYGDVSFRLESMKQIKTAFPQVNRWFFWDADTPATADALASLWSQYKTWLAAQRPLGADASAIPTVQIIRRRAVLRNIINDVIQDAPDGVIG